MYSIIAIFMVEIDVLAKGGKNMGFVVYGGFVRGLGEIRVDGSLYKSEYLAMVGREIIWFNDKISAYICGPIRICARGPTDLRLEYDFKVRAENAENQANWLYGQVQNIVLSMLKIKVCWKHNQWVGIKNVS